MGRLPRGVWKSAEATSNCCPKPKCVWPTRCWRFVARRSLRIRPQRAVPRAHPRAKIDIVERLSFEGTRSTQCERNHDFRVNAPLASRKPPKTRPGDVQDVLAA